MENHGAHATILSFVFNKNTCKLRERSTHSFFNSSSNYLLNTLYMPGTAVDTGDFSEYKNPRRQ